MSLQNLFLILLISISTMANAQDKSNNLEGFYDLSSFETFSGLYLLQDSTFFYFSSFGNVDLKIYGTYTVSSNSIYFQPTKKLLEEFRVYGRSDTSLGKYIEFSYPLPYSQKAKNLYIESDNKWVGISDFENDNTAVLKLKKSRGTNVKFGYPTTLNSDEIVLEKTFEIAFSDTTNDIRIYHNYYAEMVNEFSELSFQIGDSCLINSTLNSKPTTKQNIEEDVKSDIKAFVSHNLSKNQTIEKDGKKYYRLLVL